MNQFFSFKRFGLLVLMHWAANKKRYGLSLLAFIGLLIVRFLFYILVSNEYDSYKIQQQTTFYFSLFIVGTFYASQYFRDLGSNAKATNFLLVPASTFEKLLCSLAYTVVIFTAVLTAAYYLVDVLMVTASNEIPGTGEPRGKEAIINVFNVSFFLLRDDLRINAFLFFLSIQSAFLLGSVYFKRYGFIKTIISGFVIYFVLFAVSYFLYRPLFPGDNSEARMHSGVEQAFGIVVMYVIAPFLWILTYYRLKQKQV